MGQEVIAYIHSKVLSTPKNCLTGKCAWEEIKQDIVHGPRGDCIHLCKDRGQYNGDVRADDF